MKLELFPFLVEVQLNCIRKELDIEVIGYDIFDLLVKYWQIQINKPNELYKNLINLKNTKEEYENVKKYFKKDLE